MAAAASSRKQRGGFVLRAIVATDASFERHLHDSARPDANLMAHWPEGLRRQVLDQQFAAQTLDYARNYPDAKRLMIVSAGSPVGRLIVDRPPPALKRGWCIIDVALLPEHRGHGIGEAVLRELLREAGAARASITLTVRIHNPAKRLYARLGFRVIESEPPDLVMRWQPPGAVS